MIGSGVNVEVGKGANGGASSGIDVDVGATVGVGCEVGVEVAIGAVVGASTSGFSVAEAAMGVFVIPSMG